MAVLSITGPVVLLTVELSLSFIVPVRQDTATFTTPKDKREAGETMGWQKKQEKMQIQLCDNRYFRGVFERSNMSLISDGTHETLVES